MNNSSRFPLKFLPALLFVLLLAGAASVALTVVRLREEEGRLAKSAIQYQSQIGETSRRSHEAAAAVAQALQPEALSVRVNGRLGPVLDKHITWVNLSATRASRVALQSPGPVFDRRLVANKSATLKLLPE